MVGSGREKLDSYVPVKLKLQHPPPRRQPRGHLNFRRLACSNSLPSGQKSRSNAHQLVLIYLSSKTNFVFNQTLFTLFRERYAVMTPSNFFLKTLLKELFTKKGEILSCKFVKPCKNRKNSREYYARTSDKSGSNSPSFQGNVQIPPSWEQRTVKCPGYARGGKLKFQFDRYIMSREVSSVPYFEPVRSRDGSTVFSQLNAGAVYLKLDVVDPAFI